MDEREKYLHSIIREINRLKEKGKKSLYLINAKISSSIADYLVGYFQSFEGYTIDARSCPSCKGTWDIIITWKE